MIATRKRWFLAWWAATLLVPACDRPELFEQPLQLSGPFVTGEKAGYVESNRGEVIWLDLQPPTGQPRTIDHVRLDTPLMSPVALPGSQSSGLVGLSRDDNRLLVVPTTTAAPASYNLLAYFNRLALSTDGRVAVTYTDLTAEDQNDAVAVNNNRVAVVDLTQPESADNPYTLAIATLGGVAAGIDISPPLAVAGVPERIAFVKTPANIAMIELAGPQSATHSAPLVMPGEATSLHPSFMRFYPEAQEGIPAPATLYAMFAADGSNLAYVLTLQGTSDGLQQPTIAEYGTGTLPSDICAYELPATEASAPPLTKMLIVNSGSYNLTIVDLATGGQTTVDLGWPIHAAHLLTLPDDEGKPALHALITASNRASSRFFVVNLKTVEQRQGKAVRIKSLADNYHEVMPVPGTDRFVALHSTGGFTVLELEQDTVETISVGGSVSQAIFQPDRPILLLTTQTNQGDYLVRADVGTRPVSVQSLRLDHYPSALYVTAAGRILVSHLWPGGQVTLVDTDAFERDKAEIWTGLALDRWLDR